MSEFSNLFGLELSSILSAAAKSNALTSSSVAANQAGDKLSSGDSLGNFGAGVKMSDLSVSDCRLIQAVNGISSLEELSQSLASLEQHNSHSSHNSHIQRLRTLQQQQQQQHQKKQQQQFQEQQAALFRRQLSNLSNLSMGTPPYSRAVSADFEYNSSVNTVNAAQDLDSLSLSQHQKNQITSALQLQHAAQILQLQRVAGVSRSFSSDQLSTKADSHIRLPNNIIGCTSASNGNNSSNSSFNANGTSAVNGSQTNNNINSNNNNNNHPRRRNEGRSRRMAPSAKAPHWAGSDWNPKLAAAATIAASGGTGVFLPHLNCSPPSSSNLMSNPPNNKGSSTLTAGSTVPSCPANVSNQVINGNSKSCSLTKERPPSTSFTSPGLNSDTMNNNSVNDSSYALDILPDGLGLESSNTAAAATAVGNILTVGGQGGLVDLLNQPIDDAKFTSLSGVGSIVAFSSSHPLPKNNIPNYQRRSSNTEALLSPSSGGSPTFADSAATVVGNATSASATAAATLSALLNGKTSGVIGSANNSGYNSNNISLLNNNQSLNPFAAATGSTAINSSCVSSPCHPSLLMHSNSGSLQAMSPQSLSQNSGLSNGAVAAIAAASNTNSMISSPVTSNRVLGGSFTGNSGNGTGSITPGSSLPTNGRGNNGLGLMTLGMVGLSNNNGGGGGSGVNSLASAPFTNGTDATSLFGSIFNATSSPSYASMSGGGIYSSDFDSRPNFSNNALDAFKSELSSLMKRGNSLGTSNNNNVGSNNNRSSAPSSMAAVAVAAAAAAAAAAAVGSQQSASTSAFHPHQFAQLSQVTPQQQQHNPHHPQMFSPQLQSHTLDSSSMISFGGSSLGSSTHPQFSSSSTNAVAAAAAAAAAAGGRLYTGSGTGEGGGAGGGGLNGEERTVAHNASRSMDFPSPSASLLDFGILSVGEVFSRSSTWDMDRDHSLTQYPNNVNNNSSNINININGNNNSSNNFFVTANTNSNSTATTNSTNTNSKCNGNSGNTGGSHYLNNNNNNSIANAAQQQYGLFPVLSSQGGLLNQNNTMNNNGNTNTTNNSNNNSNASKGIITSGANFQWSPQMIAAAASGSLMMDTTNSSINNFSNNSNSINTPASLSQQLAAFNQVALSAMRNNSNNNNSGVNNYIFNANTHNNPAPLSGSNSSSNSNGGSSVTSPVVGNSNVDTYKLFPVQNNTGANHASASHNQPMVPANINSNMTGHPAFSMTTFMAPGTSARAGLMVHGNAGNGGLLEDLLVDEVATLAVGLADDCLKC